MICDLCGESKRCLPREIEGREYEICSACWNLLAVRLLGKGRAKQEREMVILPPVTALPEPKEVKPMPGEPPKIWSGTPP
jgi:hypothetical protein